MLFKNTSQNDKILSRGKTEINTKATTADVLSNLFNGKYCKADILTHLEYVQALKNEEKFVLMNNAKLLPWLLEELDGSIFIRTIELFKLLEIGCMSESNYTETITILPQYRTPELKLSMANFRSINELIKHYN